MMMLISGTRIPQDCGPDGKYFEVIDECVSLYLASMPAFLQAFEVAHECSGRTVRTAEDLNGLRYCDTMAGELIVAVNDPLADFDVFRDMEVILGLLVEPNLLRCLFANS